MAKTLEQLLSLSSIIANETKAGANTALRVGGLFSDIIYYLRDLDYADKDDIPSLEGYATEQWVLSKGYATTSDLDTRIDALVNGAPAAYDTLKEIADVLANNINSIDDILTALGTKVSKDDFNTAIANVNTAIDSLNTELGLKLDAVTFNELFEKVQLEDGTWAIKAKLGLFSDGFISAKGSNVGGTSSEGGAVALYQLNDVLADGTGVSGAQNGAVFVYDATIGKWKGVAQSEIVPNLTGYATESWVLSQGFLTQHQDLSDYAKLSDIPTTDINKGVTAYDWGDHSKVGYLTSHQSLDGYVNEIATSGNGNAITSVTKDGKKITFTKGATYLTGITSKLVTDALGYTPYDSDDFTKANIKSTLGVSDWALASSKPSYKFSEITDQPTTISGYGITDAITTANIGSQSVASANILKKTYSENINYSAYTTGLKLIKYDANWQNNGFPTNWTSGLSVMAGYVGWQLVVSGSSTINEPYFRKVSDGGIWSDWKILAYTDSNVASATKLQTARTIWGQSFDGTGDVDGVLQIGGSGDDFFKTQLSSNSFLVGLDASGKPTDFVIGWRNMVDRSVVIKSSGNVGIGTSNPQYKLDVNGETRTTKLVIGNGSIEWDETNKGFKIVGGLYTESYLSAKGANANGGGSSGGGLITSLYRYSDLGKTFSDTNNDTFNAYTINKINADLGSRISVLEGKATNVNFTQSLTSGTQIGVITIDGASKNIYAPTIPTDDINKGVTAYGWGNHASVGYAMASALSGYQTKITSSNKLDYSLISGVPTKLSQFTNDLDLGSFAYKSSLAFADLTGNPTTIGGYGITDAYTKSQVDSALGGYLPLSGGTLTSNNVALTIKRYTENPIIGFNGGAEDANERYGYLGFSGKGIPAYIDATGRTVYPIIHSGNIGSQSVASANILNKTYSENINYSAYKTELKLIRYDENWQNNGFPNNWTSGLSVMAGYVGWQLVVSGGGTNEPYFRKVSDSGKWSDWKILAYTDSNVASATKLQTARSIWGQSFDGTGDVSGTLSNVGNIYFGANNTYNIGSNTNQVLYIYTRWIGSQTNSTFAIGADNKYHLNILTNGNVGIGTTNPQYKLDVNGTLHASSTVTFDGALKVSGITSIGAEQPQYDGSRAQLSVISTANMPAMLWLGSSGEKKWSVESRGEADSYRFSLYSWVSSKHILKIEHSGVATLDGTFNATIGIYSDGYVSAKGQNTSSDMRLKNVLNDVVLSVKDIANAPSMRFSWKNGGGVDVGSSAQYWQGLLPDAVKERDGMLEMQYANIALLSAIAIAKNVETHEERIARLEKENKELRNEINSLRYGA